MRFSYRQLKLQVLFATIGVWGACSQAHLWPGGAAEADDRGEQHAPVCCKGPLGSLPEHSRAGAAGSTAADLDAAGGNRPQKPNPIYPR